ncbi:hypothetical protein WA026_014233 [Henosepilachna vigintioctopunctata]|uniref:HTH psq-type domain-containing protein n=1 Tax=Henosepilachna vigintioctopunctata TaxID=420089 RepID=A0AAW1TNB7_9CUCU
MYSFFNTPKRKSVLMDVIENNSDTPQARSLDRLNATRWISIYDAINDFSELLPYVHEALETICSWNDSTSSDANILLNAMDFEFFVSLFVISEIFGYGLPMQDLPERIIRYIKMIRTYKKKSSRGSWSVESMKHAIVAVLGKSAGYRKAAQLHGVPQTTLERHVAKIRKGEVSLYSAPGNFKPVFSKQEEEELVRYQKDMDKRFFGLTTVVLRKLAYQLAEKNRKTHKFLKILLA